MRCSPVPLSISHAGWVVVRVLVGNKCDLESKRCVLTAEGLELATQWKCPFFEVSALRNIDNIAPFHAL